MISDYISVTHSSSKTWVFRHSWTRPCLQGGSCDQQGWKHSRSPSRSWCRRRRRRMWWRRTWRTWRTLSSPSLPLAPAPPPTSSSPSLPCCLTWEESKASVRANVSCATCTSAWPNALSASVCLKTKMERWKGGPAEKTRQESKRRERERSEEPQIRSKG